MQTVHLVYIHGFQGNDTTFQSFPTHLQQYLSSHIPSHLDIQFKSSLYPTYKSVKPISYATRNFLEWLATQPPGPVILLGHSMGGLLAADAATDLSNNPDRYPGAKPKRIVGMIAFDTPYLGMHPHVVISGIASLFAKDENKEGKKKKTDKEMNDHKEVHIVDSKVTDDWEAFKRQLNDSEKHRLNRAGYHDQSSPSSSSFSSSLPSPSGIPFLDKSLNTFLTTHADEPLVRWLRKHSDAPFAAGKRWVIEHFQFGSCMFDPPDLKSRYTRLAEWNGGHWVNYWTQTPPRDSASSSTTQIAHDPQIKSTKGNGEIARSLAAALGDTAFRNASVALGLPVVGPHEREPQIDSRSTSQETLSEEPKGKLRSGHHFVVLPTGLGQSLGGHDKWEKVLVRGVVDEVSAHTGLFIPDHNVDYEAFVDRVGQKVLEWCNQL